MWVAGFIVLGRISQISIMLIIAEEVAGETSVLKLTHMHRHAYKTNTHTHVAIC